VTTKKKSKKNKIRPQDRGPEKGKKRRPFNRGTAKKRVGPRPKNQNQEKRAPLKISSEKKHQQEEIKKRKGEHDERNNP